MCVWRKLQLSCVTTASNATGVDRKGVCVERGKEGECVCMCVEENRKDGSVCRREKRNMRERGREKEREGERECVCGREREKKKRKGITASLKKGKLTSSA